jgi:hypothetical protein
VGSKRGTTGEFAAIQRELGEFPDMAFGRITPDGEIRWTHIPHEVGDGMTAMQELLTREGYTLAPTPQGRRVSGPRWWLMAKLLLGPKPPRGGTRMPWRDFDRATPSAAPIPAWCVLDADQTAALGSAARARGASVNSLLLWALDRAVEPLLSDPSRPRIWLVPVNMRGVVKIPADEANQTSGIPCIIRPGATPADVHAEIRERLRRNVHVFGLWMRRFVLWRTPREKLTSTLREGRVSPRYWTGLFSNVGEWSPAGGEPGVVWCAGAPQTFYIALGAVVMTWHGRLTMTFGAHPGLRDSSRRAQETLDAWKRIVVGLAEEQTSVKTSAAGATVPAQI